MKVLMFGWEFPPQISGGLGTACFGLTQSLLRNQIEVLFVVPRVFETPAAKKQAYLVDANDILTRSRRRTSHPSQKKSRIGSRQRQRTNSAVGVEKSLTTIATDIRLSPYNAPSTVMYPSLQFWNYALTPGYESSRNRAGGASTTALDGADLNEAALLTGSYGANLLQEVERYADVARLLGRSNRFDIIHAHDWMTFPAAIAAKSASGKPMVVHVHSTEFDRAGERHVDAQIFEIEREGMRMADRVVTVSNWTKGVVMSRYGIPEHKIRVVHNGVQPRKNVTEFEFPEIASHFVTFLGRVTHQKGPAYFVEAARHVVREFPESHFIVAGAGDLLPQIIERVAQLNMSSHFHFTGFLSPEQVDRIWSLTDVYVMPSVSEPFGIAPLEAIQGGVPVILSNQSGVAEVMPHAIKVDFWDIKALAGAICSVLRYDSLSRVLRQESKQHLKMLTWDKAASELKTVYNELSARR